MIDPRSVRDHFLPPDREAFVRSTFQTGRVIVIAPTRAACETIERALALDIDTLLRREHGEEVVDLARGGKGFGIVAGTGTGKTLAIRPIAEAILGKDLKVGVVNREREATPDTPNWNVVIVTTGIARRWFQDELITARDTIVADEIHQTSAELELCLALGKRVGCRFVWLSATVDPSFYSQYLNADAVLHTSAFDPELAATVTTHRQTPIGFIGSRFIRHIIEEKRGVAVFLPTRAEVEQLAAELGERWAGLTSAFYHGGEPVRVIRPFLDGEAPKPFLLAMTAAGQSALNISGLDTVVIHDARFAIVVEHGRGILTRKTLGSNEILQMAGRVHGRVHGGEVHILTERDLRFSDLAPTPPEFQLAGDSERVALTAAAIGVDLEDLELPVPLDRRAYRLAVAVLSDRGIIEKGRLTDYGRAVEAMPVDRPWAEMLVHCDPDMLPFVAVASNIDSLHRMTRDESDLRGLVVPGSDHLTGHNAYAEAVNQFGAVGRVFGLSRHQFSEEFDEWAESRGILAKAIEDVALGIASVYRAVERPLPERIPEADGKVLNRFADLMARVMPFDLVVDQEQANGQKTKVGRGSVCNPWGPVAGQIRYFATRQGAVRSAIEGTNIPLKLFKKYASDGDPSVVYRSRHGNRELFLVQDRVFHGFDVDSERVALREPFPEELRPVVAAGFAAALVAGATDHRDQRELGRSLGRIEGYYRKSMVDIPLASPESLKTRLAVDLADLRDLEDFHGRRLSLVVSDIVPKAVREKLDALPDHVDVHGQRVRIEYGVEDGRRFAMLLLKPREAKQLRSRDLPQLDRPIAFAVSVGRKLVRADSLRLLRSELEKLEAKKASRGRRHGHRRGRGGRPGRRR